MFSLRSPLAFAAVAASACAFSSVAAAAAPAPHVITLDDLFRFQDVGGPQVSPGGKWIAYTVSRVDPAADKRISDIWMVSWDGREDIRLTWGADQSPESPALVSSGSPEWSPDGRYLSFTSDRPGPAKGSQVWVLDRRGGEAHQLTDIKGHLSAYSWSPDAKTLLLAIQPSDEPEDDKKGANPAEKPKPKPIVIDRFHFKEDVEGYLTDKSYTELWLWNVATHKLEKLTTDKKVDETNAVWSPDGTRIAFVSNQDPDPDRSINTDVFVVDAKPNSTPRRLTHYDGQDGGRIAWSPDGKSIAFLRGDVLKYWQYSQNKLGIVPADGSASARILTASLDRAVSSPVFSPDGKSIEVLVTDDRSEYPASVDIASGQVHRDIAEPGSAMGLSERAGHTALVWTTDPQPGEIYALDSGSVRRLTHHNDALMAELKLGQTRDITATSQDGAQVHGLITLPPGATDGKKYPTLLFIHGGPDGQDAHEFSILRQLFAGHGYAVLNVNYRGSSGRGTVWQKAIADDWGHLEVQDLLASVDEVVKEGIADPSKLAVGGWSYGGILTDYMIASTNRFKAASSGAGTGDPLALYGVDEYILQYNNEIGPPWKDTQQYLKLGYPFFHADRIHTPTLFMGGTFDFNVPLVAGEQMYEALRTLNVPAELIVYPGQFHGFTRPSFIRDRYQYWFSWYDKWVLGKTDAAVPAQQ